MQQSSTTPVRSGVCGVNDDDPRYKCCCGATHVRTGATVLAIVELTLAAVGVLGAVAGTGDYRYKNGARGGSAFNSLMTIVVCSLMIYGLRKTKRYMLIPHMVFQVLTIVICFIFGILFLVGAIVLREVSQHLDEQHAQPEQQQGSVGTGVVFLAIVGAAVFCFIGALEICFFSVVLRAFRYLRDKETANFLGNSVVHYSNSNA